MYIQLCGGNKSVYMVENHHFQPWLARCKSTAFHTKKTSFCSLNSILTGRPSTPVCLIINVCSIITPGNLGTWVPLGHLGACWGTSLGATGGAWVPPWGASLGASWGTCLGATLGYLGASWVLFDFFFGVGRSISTNLGGVRFRYSAYSRCEFFPPMSMSQ